MSCFIKVVTHEACIPEVKNAYVNFLNHCYVDTEVEMKEIYSSSHIWELFDYFMIDMEKVNISVAQCICSCLTFTLY